MYCGLDVDLVLPKTPRYCLLHEAAQELFVLTVLAKGGRVVYPRDVEDPGNHLECARSDGGLQQKARASSEEDTFSGDPRQAKPCAAEARQRGRGARARGGRCRWSMRP